MPKQGSTDVSATGESEAISSTQASGGPDRPVEGVTDRTADVNPDSAPEQAAKGAAPSNAAVRGGSDRGGMAGPVGYFEGEGNEGPLAPLGGDVTKSAEDGTANSQGGVASGAPD
jgi:hypothetical protein